MNRSRGEATHGWLKIGSRGTRRDETKPHTSEEKKTDQNCILELDHTQILYGRKGEQENRKKKEQNKTKQNKTNKRTMGTVTGTGTTTGMDMDMGMIWAYQWHGFRGSGTRSIDTRLTFFRLKRQGSLEQWQVNYL